MSDDWLGAYRDRRVLVTGATGFIGWHVARALHEAGAEVLVTARPSGGASTGAPTAGLLTPTDLAVPGSAAAVVAEFKPSITFNLAGYGVDPAERSVPLSERLNTELPAELASACAEWADAEWSGQQLVHAGSALEYGLASGDLREATAVQPTTLYGTTKAAGAQRVLRAMHRQGLRAAVARLFTVYGPREHEGRLLPTLIRAAGSEGPIPLTAGTQRRDFTWVGDVVEGVLRLGARHEADVGVVNVATGTLHTVREFVERAAEVIGIAPGRLEFGALPTRAEEMQHDHVSVAKLQTLTGWRPATSIAEGVRRTLDAG